MAKGVASEADVLKLARLGKLDGIELGEMVLKLTQGYNLRVYWFELLECARKLALVCVPVFFVREPASILRPLDGTLMPCPCLYKVC